jgi:hypothetical protein
MAAALEIIAEKTDFPPHKIRPRCGLCQLWNSNRNLFWEILEQSIAGQHGTKMLALLKKNGVKAALQTIYTHRNKHVIPDMQKSLEIAENARAMGRYFGAAAPLDSAQGLMHVALAKLFSAISAVDGEKLKRISPEKLLNTSARIAEVLSNAQKASADIEVKKAQLLLARMKAAQKKEDLLWLLVEWLNEKLQPYPELLKQLEAVIENKLPPRKALTAKNA